MILITGAAGKTGLAVLDALSAEGQPVRALVRRPEQEEICRRSGARESVVADLSSAADLRGTMEGVRALYLLVPNLHPDEIEIGRCAIENAKQAGVRRIVYHSVLHPQTRDMPHHWRKLAVEELVLRSELEFTILQPSAYMQNLLPYWNDIVDRGVYRVPYGERGALSLVDLEDVAAVAAKVLTRSGHESATYELAGPEALSPGKIARLAAQKLGRTVRAEAVAVEEWTRRARQEVAKGYRLEALVAMFDYYDRYGLVGNSKVLELLLGRPPRTLDRFLDGMLRSDG